MKHETVDVTLLFRYTYGDDRQVKRSLRAPTQKSCLETNEVVQCNRNRCDRKELACRTPKSNNKQHPPLSRSCQTTAVKNPRLRVKQVQILLPHGERPFALPRHSRVVFARKIGTMFVPKTLSTAVTVLTRASARRFKVRTFAAASLVSVQVRCGLCFCHVLRSCRWGCICLCGRH